MKFSQTCKLNAIECTFNGEISYLKHGVWTKLLVKRPTAHVKWNYICATAAITTSICKSGTNVNVRTIKRRTQTENDLHNLIRRPNNVQVFLRAETIFRTAHIIIFVNMVLQPITLGHIWDTVVHKYVTVFWPMPSFLCKLRYHWMRGRGVSHQ